MTVDSEFEVANEQYAAGFDKGDLPMPPGRCVFSSLHLSQNIQWELDLNMLTEGKKKTCRKVFVLTCMDARLDPAKFLGLKEGDAHVYRNAGGRAAEALRSVIISQQALGTRRIVVIHHVRTHCLSSTLHHIYIMETHAAAM